MNARIMILAAALAASTLVGCAGDRHKTQKAAATEQWNAARANVLGSLAKDQYESGNLAKSRGSVDQALQLDPKNVNLHILSARIDIEQAKLESAQNRLTTAAALDPKNAEIDYLIGVVAQRWQRPEAALAAYQSASEKKPEDIAYVLAEMEMLVELERSDEALKLLKSRVVYFEHSAAIRDAIAQLLEQAGEYPDAVEYYRQACVLDGEDLGIRERLGNLLYRGGEYREALSQLNRVLRSPETESRTDLKLMAAECELQIGSAADARRRFDEITVEEPNNAAGWLGVAKSSLRLGELRRAEGGAVKAAAIAPKSAEMQMVLGYVRLKQERYDDAIVCFSRAGALDRTHSTSLSMTAFALERQGKVAEAASMYRQALAIDPRDELALRALAVVD